MLVQSVKKNDLLCRANICNHKYCNVNYPMTCANILVPYFVDYWTHYQLKGECMGIIASIKLIYADMLLGFFPDFFPFKQ